MAAARTDYGRTATMLRLWPGERLHVQDVVPDAGGTRHVRYTRTFRGLPVLGGDLIVHTAPGGRVSVDRDTAVQPASLQSLVPRVAAGSAARVALRSSDLDRAVSSRLVVWGYGGPARLAWEVRTVSSNQHRPAAGVVIVDARSGRAIRQWDELQTVDAVGTGQTLYNGDVRLRTHDTRNAGPGRYRLVDLTRGKAATCDMNNRTEPNPGDGTGVCTTFADRDNTWGNNRLTSRQTTAADAAYGGARTWDYYASTFGREGIRGNGKVARTRVHYGRDYSNAFWSDQCFCMTYGDGDGDRFGPLVALDVAGHEMSHGVTSATAGLNYVGESGGLNESTSDIFGSMVEFQAHNSRDRGDYLIGEEVARSGLGHRFLRRMDRPFADGVSPNCWSPSLGALDPHNSSGVGNHFYYLLAEGSGAKQINGTAHNSPTCDGSTLRGIGKHKAERLWYQALTAYWLPGTGYRQARDGTIRAAIGSYGAGSPQCKAVVRSWKAVDVPVGEWGCTGRLEPAPAGANPVGNPGFETGPRGWVQRSTSDFQPIGPYAGYTYQGRFAAFLRGFGVRGTDSVAQAGIRVPDRPRMTLYFQLAVMTYEEPTAAFDRLKVQVRRGTGAWRTLSLYSNATTPDWTYHQRALSLTAYRGRTVSVRFLATEDSGAPTAFLVDNVSVKRG